MLTGVRWDARRGAAFTVKPGPLGTAENRTGIRKRKDTVTSCSQGGDRACPLLSNTLGETAMSTEGDTAGPCRYRGCSPGAQPGPPRQTSVQMGGTADRPVSAFESHLSPPPQPGSITGPRASLLVQSAPTHPQGRDFPETHATHCPSPRRAKWVRTTRVGGGGGGPTGQTVILKEPRQEETDLRRDVCDRTSRRSPGPSPGQVLARPRRPLLLQ